MPRTIIRQFRDAKGTVPSRDWIKQLEKKEPKSYRKRLAAIAELREKGFVLQRPLVGALGDKNYELRWHLGTVNYRITFFWYESQAVFSHGFTKEGEVPPIQIDRTNRNRRLVEADSKKHLEPLPLG